MELNINRLVDENNKYKFLYSEVMGITVFQIEELKIFDENNHFEDIEYTISGRLIDKMKFYEDLIEKLQFDICRMKNEMLVYSEWIDSEEFDLWNNEWKKCFKCSNCEETQDFESKYCSNCGAKMGKE